MCAPITCIIEGFTLRTFVRARRRCSRVPYGDWLTPRRHPAEIDPAEFHFEPGLFPDADVGPHNDFGVPCPRVPRQGKPWGDCGVLSRSYDGAMHIEISNGNTVGGNGARNEWIQSTLEENLDRFQRKLTRVDVHLGGHNGAKGGESDVYCSMEARVRGQKPIAVTHDASNVHDAVTGAAGRLQRALEHSIGRIESRT